MPVAYGSRLDLYMAFMINPAHSLHVAILTALFSLGHIIRTLYDHFYRDLNFLLGYFRSTKSRRADS